MFYGVLLSNILKIISPAEKDGRRADVDQLRGVALDELDLKNANMVKTSVDHQKNKLDSSTRFGFLLSIRKTYICLYCVCIYIYIDM